MKNTPIENEIAPGFIIEEFEESKPQPEDDGSERITFLSKLLRVLGASVIIAAASIFLIQNWGYGNDIQRYLLLLGFTVLLSLAGFFCGLRIRENKGARTLLGLTLAVMPVHFAVLGGLLYSQFPMDGAIGVLPNFAIWIAGDPMAALVTTAGAIAVLAPLTYLSTLVLGREGAREISATFFVANLVMLVPYRDPLFVAVIVVVMAVALVWADVKLFRPKAAMKTFEGRFMRSMTAVPLLLILARSFKFYIYSDILLAAVLGSVALATFVLGPGLTDVVRSKKMVQYASAVPAAISWFILAYNIVDAVNVRIHWFIPIFSLPLSALFIGMSFFSVGEGSGFRRAGAVTALAGGLAHLLLFPGLTSSLLCLIVGVAVVVYSCLVEQKIIFFTGLLSIICSLGYHMKFAIRFYSLSNWGALAITGMLIIITASVVERNHQAIIDKATQFRQKLKGWDY